MLEHELQVVIHSEATSALTIGMEPGNRFEDLRGPQQHGERESEALEWLLGRRRRSQETAIAYHFRVVEALVFLGVGWIDASLFRVVS